ncbi:MAG TPA: DNA-directed RNA polymerase subunit omega [Verrucomicrobiota bacterium]|nr:DNA-directed RNA polymerase subunit omega [Verrucomicrobiota bacterium]
MNSELCKKALEKVKNPNILVNLVSKRVRQLNSGGGSMSRPLVEASPSASMADIALMEIIEGKITYELPPETEVLTGDVKHHKRRKAS